MMLKLSNITKNFGTKKVLDGFSYEFPDTGIYVLVGQSGSGKTTLLRIISGLDKDFEGKIDIPKGKKISMMFQEHRLFESLSALQNILIASFNKSNELDVENAKFLLNRLKINENDFVLKPSKLSGGMKQRVSLARAILKDSDILLLDEPLKELDPDLASCAMEIIKELSLKKLVIMVTHRLEFLENFSYATIQIENLNS